MGEGGGVYKVLVGNPEAKIPQRRPRRIWEDNIKDGSSGCGDTDWIELVQNSDRWRELANAVMNRRVP
jgi:hypothetical protein